MDSTILIKNVKEWLRLKKEEPIDDLAFSSIPVELFNAEQMERHGATLALSHKLSKKSAPDLLLGVLTESESILIKSCNTLSNKAPNDHGYSPAQEWLLDNFYLIQEQISMIRRHLPKGYGRALPKLTNRKPGYPRVYDLALHIIEHGDGRVDFENLKRFIDAYQSITPLSLGELWAIPIVLGVALVENLSSMSKRVVTNKSDRALADTWADRMIEVAVSSPKKLVIALADMVRSESQMSSAFVSELARRLQGNALALPLSWVEQHLAHEGLSIEQLVQEENKHQAANQVTISNSITGLRSLSEINWRDFVESMSVIEHTLRTDPTGSYAMMDFGTRDRYRQVVERFSRQSGHPESLVAQTAINLAKNNADSILAAGDIMSSVNERYCHVGYYLISKGLAQLSTALGVRHSWWQKISHFITKCSLLSYLGSIVLITSGLLYALLSKATQSGISYVWLWVLGILIAVCTSQLAISLVNLGVSFLVKPQPLPRMDFTKGIPSSLSTLVVVPTMLVSASGIESLIEALEVRFLGNRDDHLYFALLTDFNDAKEEHMPDDAALVALASAKIAELNKKYSEIKDDIFFLFHRPRQWNANEKVWMGKERKRGKLTDLNNLLRTKNTSCFSTIVGSTDNLRNIKYVITLDSDTQLPLESAQQYVGTMAHPLNRPLVDESKQLVIEGYGILQPRIAETIPSKGPTRYVWLMGSELGIDPYTRTVSDIYQDVFCEGSFIGKGIYDVDIFEQILEKRLPDNQILSHDLIEGCYIRSGFLSDVPLYEHSPGSYLADAKRRMRWIRGDWQIAGWICGRVLNADKKRVKNPLTLLSRYKLFDNLRRSFLPIALMLLMGLSWTILPASCFWLGIILAIIVLPAVAGTLIELVRKPTDMLPRQHIAHTFSLIRRRVGQLIIYLCCLPHEAWYSLVAIVITCWRNIVSKKHLLEWAPSDQVNKKLGNSLIEWTANMWAGPAAALFAVILIAIEGRWTLLLFAMPLLVLWFTSPIIMRYLSSPFQRNEPKLNQNQIRFLHQMARKTWAFFETFITKDDHWLPPDNFQEAPVEALARRTSPTNMGLSLLANLTAFDFGYINFGQLLERTKNALDTMIRLEQYHGHFYNWYSTETLAPLLPRYISTVDSGNLAGHLLTLRQGLLALPDVALLNLQYLHGLEDTCEVLIATYHKFLPSALKDFQNLLNDPHLSFKSWASASTVCQKLTDIAKKMSVLDEQTAEMATWSNKLYSQCLAIQAEIALYADIPGLGVKATLRDIALLTEHKEASQKAVECITSINTFCVQANLLSQMDMSFLYDEANHLMTIGFNADEQRKDQSNYDLLCSEARLGSFVAIAQGEARQESWFALGRLLVSNRGDQLLISWSGSMFEYLMPLLVMPTYSGTLLDQTYHAVVKQQIAYGKLRGVPWGISESGYNALDTHYNYLYRAFGVPGLGLKRGLENDLVIAPYASVLALMVEPVAACVNLQRLDAEHASGKFGFYEAIDFTASRIPPENKRAIIRSFMAHHQGMSFLALSYHLHDQPMQQRFVSDPLFRATLLLLQERIPKPTASYLQIPKSPNDNNVSKRPEASMREFTNPNSRTPQVQLLSNGRYHLVLTQAGGGYSRWKDIAVTRWREDSISDNWGLFSYIRDIVTGKFWSTTYQPTTGSVEGYKVTFSESLAEFNRSDMWLDMHSEVVVSPEDDVELRRVRIHNRGKIRRTIEFTSYGELVLGPQGADQSQPAFNNLFVETEFLTEQQAILATRRPQDGNQSAPWLCHLLNVRSKHDCSVSFETDRTRFVGRCRTLASPLAMTTPGPLSNTQGAVLDPIVAIRCQLTLEADDIVLFDLITGIADTRDHCVALVNKYQDRPLANRIFGLAWTYGQVLLHQLNVSEADAQLYGRLAGAIIYASNTRRADANIIASNRRGQSGLWGYSISGDLPIVLVYIEDVENIELVRQVIQAQAYWRRKGLMVDIIIINEEHVSYRQTLQEQIMGLITASPFVEHAGTITIRFAEQIPLEDSILFQSVARVILTDKRGTLKEQLRYRRVSPPVVPLLRHVKSVINKVSHKLTLPPNLQFFNGLGGFSESGNEYVIQLSEGLTTPEPWTNVLANANFGTLVTESGQGYTWTENSHEFRLTPWENDPLQDSASEAFYLRDDESGLVWSPTALPRRGRGDYQTRHGFGYSVFEHIEDGIHTELWMYVALDAPVKFIVLKIRNDSMRQRSLSATGYVAWVLGELRTKNAMHIVTEVTENGALLAQNHYNTDIGERTAFFNATANDVDLHSLTVTGDRAEFLGRNGTLNQPSALSHKFLSGRVGAGLDPCGAIQLSFNLEIDQACDIIFTLGAGQDKQDAKSLLQRYHGAIIAEEALACVRQYWQRTLSMIKVKTPDPTVNLLANGWLLYQILSSRLWGRSGYFQSSGAFGFRDQLQDVMSLTQVAPTLLRDHILLCAKHQFEAGDVQHWWHPPHNRGVRTRCSDDYLWLPFAISHYIEATGDMTILDEAIPFLQGRPLKDHEESYYDLPMMGTNAVSLYQHAVHAINKGLNFGQHGLPLIGSGDWNDGMNLIGIEGKGESIWLGFFLYNVLEKFSSIATRYGDGAFAKRCNEQRTILQQQLADHGWDNEWYLRAYFDDGSLVGSASNGECRIDSIAQSWSVLSGAADATRAKQAMKSLYHYLVKPEDGLVKLLDPPFNKSIPNPGYIQGYLPGIRENGGQYTHGAVWAAMAFAKLGEKERAWELFNIINPINHGRNPDEVNRYKLEPYVLAGDVYSVEPHIGRGGWSWYTGSAGWFYRLVTETLLGITLVDGKQLQLSPLLPNDWDRFNIEYSFGKTKYDITIKRATDDVNVILDGTTISGNLISLVDDGQIHQVIYYCQG